MHMIQLERVYLLQNFINNIPLVWKWFVIWKKIIFIFLSFFFRFGLWRFSFISLFVSSHQPLSLFSRRVHRGHLFLQSKTRKCLLWVTFMKHKIFSRDILTFQLSFWRYLQAHSVLNNELLAERLTQLWLLKWFSVYYKKPLKSDLTIQYFTRLFRTVLTISAVSTWKNKGEKVVNVKEKYEILRNSKFH